MHKRDRFTDIKVPYIPKEIVEHIHYMKETAERDLDVYDMIDRTITYHYQDTSLDWIYRSPENMNAFALAWILDDWIMF